MSGFDLPARMWFTDEEDAGLDFPAKRKGEYEASLRAAAAAALRELAQEMDDRTLDCLCHMTLRERADEIERGDGVVPRG